MDKVQEYTRAALSRIEDFSSAAGETLEACTKAAILVELRTMLSLDADNLV